MRATAFRSNCARLQTSNRRSQRFLPAVPALKLRTPWKFSSPGRPVFNQRYPRRMCKELLGAMLRSIAPGAVLCAAVFAQQVPQFTILPFAGASRDIGDNGPATSALLNSPHGVPIDRSGNSYIADTPGD